MRSVTARLTSLCRPPIVWFYHGFTMVTSQIKTKGMFCARCQLFVPASGWHKCFADSMHVPSVDMRCFDQSVLNMAPMFPCRACGVNCASGLCSKRCTWSVESKCPQCGRGRPEDQAFCSVSCASQAAQANWCGTCGLRQIQMGMSHCSDVCASSGMLNVPVRQRRKVAHQINNLSHQIVSAKDRSRIALTAAVAPLLAESGHTVVNVVKCAEHALRKKAYLNYRALVEQQLSTNKCAKYCHGGEGNEHKQYIPLVLKCSLGAGSNPFALPQTPVDCCNDPLCEVCSMLNCGMNLRLQGKASHYSTANPSTAVSWCRPQNQFGLMAVAVCRVVVGTPNIVSCSEEVSAPRNFTTHSCIVSDGNPSNDGTYVFRDDAIDVQNIILFV